MLEWICLELAVVLTCYFDDFVCLSSPILAKSAELTFEALLDLLGWRFDKTGEKASEMGATVSALGVIFNLEQTSEGLLEVQNTEKRKKDLCVQIARTLDEGIMTAAAASLKGRLGFAEGQLFGRSTRRLINCYAPTKAEQADGEHQEGVGSGSNPDAAFPASPCGR